MSGWFETVGPSGRRTVTALLQDGDAVSVTGSSGHYDLVVDELSGPLPDEALLRLVGTEGSGAAVPAYLLARSLERLGTVVPPVIWSETQRSLVVAPGSSGGPGEPGPKVPDELVDAFGQRAEPALWAWIAEQVRGFHRLAVTTAMDSDRFSCFVERLAENPSAAVRDGLLDWVADNGLELLSDGRVLAWKGLTDAGTSTMMGHAFVERAGRAGRAGTGQKATEEVLGDRVPNPVAAIVSMPRDEVEHEGSSGCGHGLHVAGLGFARSFGHDLLAEVAVDPVDVVHLVDFGGKGQEERAGYGKARVAKYEVVAVSSKRLEALR